MLIVMQFMLCPLLAPARGEGWMSLQAADLLVRCEVLVPGAAGSPGGGAAGGGARRAAAQVARHRRQRHVRVPAARPPQGAGARPLTM